MKRHKIFVTGSSGFIAKNILEQLAGKYQFVAPGHKELNLLDSAAVEKFFSKSKYFDFVIHAAIVGGNRKIPNTSEIAAANLCMFFNVVKNRRYFGKMIHLGSGIEYGKERALKKVHEKDFGKFIPQDNFGFYKYLCGKYIENSEGILNLRLFGVFGKYEDATIRFISNAICKSILGMPITIHRNAFFDYLHVDDFVKILDYFLNHKPHYKSYNVCTGRKVDLLTLARKINMLAANRLPLKIATSGIANEYTADNSRLLGSIGNFSFTDLSKSLEELYKWYLSQKPKLRKKDFLDDHFD